jgi:hypothetical protein
MTEHNDDVKAVFDQLVYAVTLLIHGEHPGNHTILKRLVADSLKHRGVWEVLSAAMNSTNDKGK